MLKPIKTKQQMMGIVYILELSLLVCAVLFVYGAINFSAIALAIQNTLFNAASCNCVTPFCGGVVTTDITTTSSTLFLIP